MPDQVDRTVVAQGPTTAAGRHTTAHDARSLGGVSVHRPLTFLFGGLCAFALLGAALLVTASPVSAAPLAPAGACSTGVGNAGGQGLICEVTIANTITASGGSATVTVRECLGSAGDPTDGARGHPCTTTTTALSDPVTAVTQCNGSINGAGGKLLCSVVVTNTFIGVSPGTTAVTVNQCVGSGGGITTGCNPFPATTTDAAITQCNGSANGGTLVGLTCTATGTMASALGVTINQCNGSANGGGALVVCSANLVNSIGSPPAPTPTGSLSPTAAPTGSLSPTAAPTGSLSPTATPTGSLSPTPGQTPPATSTASDRSSNNSTPLFALLICLAFGALGVTAVEARRRSIRR